jgi:hypothetical protein
MRQNFPTAALTFYVSTENTDSFRNKISDILIWVQ